MEGPDFLKEKRGFRKAPEAGQENGKGEGLERELKRGESTAPVAEDEPAGFLKLDDISRDIEELKREAEKEGKLLAEIALKIKDLAAPAEYFPESPENGEEKEFAVEELENEINRLLGIAESVSYDAQKKIAGKFETALRDLEQIKPESEPDIQKINAILDSISGPLMLVKKNLAALPATEKKLAILKQKHLTVRLKKAGFDSLDEVKEAERRAREELYQLKKKRAGLGKFFSKKEILKLERELNHLTGLTGVEFDPFYQELFYQDSHAFMSSHIAYSLKNSAERVAGTAGKKLADYYEQIIRSIGEKIEKKRIGTQINEETLEELEDNFIKKLITEQIDADTLGEEAINRAVSIVKRSAAFSLWKPLSDEEKEIREEAEKLPLKLRMAVRWVKEKKHREGGASFQEMADFAAAVSRAAARREIEKSYRTVLENFKASGNFQLWVEAMERLRKLEPPESAPDFVDSLDARRWETFRENAQIKNLLGKERLEAADRFIGEIIAQRLMNQESRTDGSVTLGFKLLSFINEETLPVIILNAYREQGYSGECPFLRVAVPSRETKLFKVLDNLSDDQLRELKEKNIPGIYKVVELIRGNPENFNDRYKDGERIIRNAVYDGIIRELDRASRHYLRSGDETAQFFALEVLERLNTAELDEETHQIINGLLKTGSARIARKALDCYLSRARYEDDGKSLSTLLQNYREPGFGFRKEVEAAAPEFFGTLINSERVNQDDIETFSGILGIAAPELARVRDFIRKIPGRGFFGEYRYSPEKFRNCAELAANPQNLELIIKLFSYGYQFNADHVDALKEIRENRGKIFPALEELKRDFPDFLYVLSYSHRESMPGAPESEGRPVFITDPYEILISRAHRLGYQDSFEMLAELYEKEGSLRRKFSDGFIGWLRKEDPALVGPAGVKTIPETTYKRFNEALVKFINTIRDPERGLAGRRDFLLHPDVLYFLARQPERIEDLINLPQSCPELFKLLSVGEPLYGNRDNVIHDIFKNGDIVRRSREIAGVFLKRVPYWRQLYLFTRTRIGEQLRSADTNYPITQIGGISIDSLVKRHKETKTSGPATPSRLERIVPNPVILEKLANGEMASVPFKEISGMYKEVVYRDYLKMVIETSRDRRVKAEADRRNRALAAEKFSPQEGLYVHGSAIDHIEAVLLSGNLPRESLGEEASTDNYPFQVDFTKLQREFIEMKETTSRIFTESLSGSYGINGRLGKDGQIFYAYDREDAGWEKGKEYGIGHHALVLGGMPSTEISGIFLRSAETTLEKAKSAVLENGFYIPIYDIDGNLLFTDEEYDEIFDDLNLSVSVEVWDYSLKTGEQLGSNPAAEFTVPAEKESKKYYVKFATQEGGTSHIWNEQLADEIYRILGVPVPETKIVKVEGNYGHASELLEGDHADSGTIKESSSWLSGFLADALLANWDIPYAPDRNAFLGSDGRVYRLDNGGALIFRARGQRKTEELFGNKVHEIEIGANHERLGLGMRQEYPGLSDENIARQLDNLKEKLTDQVIDRAVDGVRLSKKDRNHLKGKLKARRDYILEKFKKKSD